MRKLLVVCDMCKQGFDGDPYVFALEDREEPGRYYESVRQVDLCPMCEDKIERLIRRVRAEVISMDALDEFTKRSSEAIPIEPATVAEAMTPKKEVEEAPAKPEEPKKTEPEKPKKKRTKIDGGRIRALTNAGWSPKAVADDMRLTSKQVSAWLYNHKDELI